MSGRKKKKTCLLTIDIQWCMIYVEVREIYYLNNNRSVNVMEKLKSNVALEVGSYCRHYRMFVAELTLKDVVGENYVKNLSAFEHGRSSNLIYLLEYMRLADERFELDEFVSGLMGIVKINWANILGGK